VLFKFLVGSPINNLQSGLILSQFGGLLMIFMAFIAGDKMDENGARYMFAGIGSIRLIIPILMGNFFGGLILKIAFWIVAILSALKLLETFVAVSAEGLGFIWYFFITGLVEVAVLIHLLSSKGRAELKNQ
jgi:hypothetical protein